MADEMRKDFLMQYKAVLSVKKIINSKVCLNRNRKGNNKANTFIFVLVLTERQKSKLNSIEVRFLKRIQCKIKLETRRSISN